MGAYVVWAMNFKSDFRFDLRGCLEAILASKNLILRTSIWNLEVLNPPKIFINHPKIKFSISLQVSRRYYYLPCWPKTASLDSRFFQNLNPNSWILKRPSPIPFSLSCVCVCVFWRKGSAVQNTNWIWTTRLCRRTGCKCDFLAREEVLEIWSPVLLVTYDVFVDSVRLTAIHTNACTHIHINHESWYERFESWLMISWYIAIVLIQHLIPTPPLSPFHSTSLGGGQNIVSKTNSIGSPSLDLLRRE